MRLVNPRQRQRGFTLIELLVALSVMALLAMQGAPALSAYLANSRIREAANVVVTTAALARNEAIKRNTSVTLDADGSTLTLSYTPVGVPTTLRTVTLPSTVRVATFSATFDSSGRLAPLGTDIQARVEGSNVACGDDIVCPTVHIEAGGMVGLCTAGACP
jgi:prepilin-type N-terminal cleavage/methylation domain-containing protein